MDQKAYRPDIDGLRAVAVLAVLAFHLDLDTFSGGYVGVDIFFVISGFLITQLILKEINATGTFRFGRFYLRRLRRLYPALLATLTLTFVCAVLWLSPAKLERTGGAMATSLLSLSNVFFWTQTGYFDTASPEKPLLHTWSLGVEEQFYLFWPLLLFLVARPSIKWLVPVVLTGVGALSLWLNLVFADGEISIIRNHLPAFINVFADGNATIFFLTPFRVFEFAIGALMVWIVRIPTRHPVLEEMTLLLGGALITYTILVYNERTPFPTVFALAPCIGAAMMIYGGRARKLGQLLSNPVSVFLGRISYSLYLVHWPIIVYWQIYFMRELGGIDRIAVTTLTVLSAWLMNRFVEQPFRYAKPNAPDSGNPNFALACATATILLMIPSATAWQQQGWPSRVPAAMAGIKYDPKDTLEPLWNSGFGSEEEFTDEKISVVVLGISYGLDVALMLRDHPETESWYPGSTGHLCRAFTLPPLPEDDIAVSPPQDCPANIRYFTRDYPNTDVVVLAEGFTIWDTSNELLMNELQNNVQLLRENGFDGPVVVYGERPSFRNSIPQLAFRYGRRAGFNELATSMLGQTIEAMNARTAIATEFYAQHGIHYYSPVPLLCSDDLCNMFTPDDDLVYIDDSHFTPEGDAYLAVDFIHFLKSLPELAPN